MGIYRGPTTWKADDEVEKYGRDGGVFNKEGWDGTPQRSQNQRKAAESSEAA